MPVIFPSVARTAGAAIGRRLHQLGLRAPHLAEEWSAYAALTEPENRQPFVRTLRSVIDVNGQAVSAHDRLYLAARLPTLIVWGRRDHIIPPGHADAAHEAIPGSRLVIFERAGHFPHVEEPAAFVEAVTDFVESTEPMHLDEPRVAGGTDDRSSLIPDQVQGPRHTSVTGADDGGHGERRSATEVVDTDRRTRSPDPAPRRDVSCVGCGFCLLVAGLAAAAHRPMTRSGAPPFDRLDCGDVQSVLVASGDVQPMRSRSRSILARVSVVVEPGSLVEQFRAARPAIERALEGPVVVDDAARATHGGEECGDGDGGDGGKGRDPAACDDAGFGLVSMVGSCWWFVALTGDHVMSRWRVRRTPAAASPAT